MPFQKGHKFAKGGARPHSGPPKDEVKAKFRAILEASNAHKRFEDILRTESDREIFLKAYQICLDRGYGKPAIDLEVTSDDAIDIAAMALLIQRVRSKDADAA